MTLKEHVDIIKHLVKLISDDSESKYSDAFIYELLVSSRAVILANYYSKKKNMTSEFDVQSFCVKLIETNYWDDCACIPSGDCKVFRSMYEIPSTLTGKLQVFTINGKKRFSPMSPFELTTYKNSPISPTYNYHIKNNYLYILTSPNRLIAARVEGIFEDPTDWEGKTYCDDTTEDCYDITTSRFPLHSRFNIDVWKVVLTQLGYSLNSIDDVFNDAEFSIKPIL